MQQEKKNRRAVALKDRNSFRFLLSLVTLLLLPFVCLEITGGLLNATFGNAVEMILSVQALRIVSPVKGLGFRV